MSSSVFVFRKVCLQSSTNIKLFKTEWSRNELWKNTWSCERHSPQIKETWSKGVHSALLQTERLVHGRAPHLSGWWMPYYAPDSQTLLGLTHGHLMVTRLGVGALYSTYLGHGGRPGGSIITPAHLTRAATWPTSLCQHLLGQTEAEFNIPVWRPITTSGASRGSDNNVFIWLLGALGATNCSISSGLWDQMWRY